MVRNVMALYIDNGNLFGFQQYTYKYERLCMTHANSKATEEQQITQPRTNHSSEEIQQDPLSPRSSRPYPLEFLSDLVIWRG